ALYIYFYILLLERHLGAELAKLLNLTLVTEGFFGAGDLVGRNFCEEKEIKAKGQRHSIYHVIPHKDHNKGIPKNCAPRSIKLLLFL
ncbi:unnamed protein product, partial [Larinioides sclopetarius]